MDARSQQLLMQLLGDTCSLDEITTTVRTRFPENQFIFIGLFIIEMIETIGVPLTQKVAGIYLLFALYDDVPIDKHPFSAILLALTAQSSSPQIYIKTAKSIMTHGCTRFSSLTSAQVIKRVQEDLDPKKPALSGGNGSSSNALGLAHSTSRIDTYRRMLMGYDPPLVRPLPSILPTMDNELSWVDPSLLLPFEWDDSETRLQPHLDDQGNLKESRPVSPPESLKAQA
ncbi:hypothetical protein BLNAU_15029 [Blattamonas nauphoetae]|uniref:CCR4-NOT transcription complex subunit 11 n=1 Tax=Blattamonas nauphoetae TaxID=2049346 RepID=A0ABQ9XF04_9EUKA|nr:hypothetical protein BLNAU_15029 [Blattamonas nauphoetae]